ncbi:hypothetical protein Tco_0362836 [Tanacetum coccineum]
MLVNCEVEKEIDDFKTPLMMVVKEIKDGLMEEMEVVHFGRKDMVEWQGIVWIEEDAKDGLAKQGSAT